MIVGFFTWLINIVDCAESAVARHKLVVFISSKVLELIVQFELVVYDLQMYILYIAR